MQAKLGTECGDCSHKLLKLKIPVQIIHAAVEKESNRWHETDVEEELRVPAYVP